MSVDSVLLENVISGSMKGIHIQVDDDLYDLVKRKASLSGLTLADFVRLALRQAVGLEKNGVRALLEPVSHDEFEELSRVVRELHEEIKLLKSALSSGSGSRQYQNIGSTPILASDSMSSSKPPKQVGSRSRRAVSSSLEELVLSVMNRDPEKAWSSREISGILLDEGVDVNPESIKNRILRMYNRRRLEKVGKGLYKLKP